VSKSLFALMAAVAALAIIVAGCGGGSDSSSSGASTSSLTKAEFLKQGNAICAKGNEEIEEGFEAWVKENHLKQSQKPTEAQLAQVSEEVLIPQVRKEIDGIRALGLPSEGGEDADEVLKAAEKGLEEGEEDPIVLTHESGTSFAEANKLAREYGLTKCGEEGGGG
jgi:hypothetical protein